MLTPINLKITAASYDGHAYLQIQESMKGGVWGHAGESFLRFLCHERASGAI